MTRKSGGVVMRVGPESCGAPSWQHAEGSREREREKEEGRGREKGRAREARPRGPFFVSLLFLYFPPAFFSPPPRGPVPT